jgi:hypothetical protein
MGETATHLVLDAATEADMLLLDAQLEAQYHKDFEELDQVTWSLASELVPDLEREAQRRTIQFLGGVAIRGEAGEPIAPAESNKSNLMTATQLAAMGDAQARRMIYNNAATDVAERLFKAAHQTKIQMHMVDGHLEQEGRLLTDIHRSTLEHTVLNGEMLRRTKSELKNALLFEQLHQRGILRDYDAVVFSPSSTTMSPAEKKSYGLFVDTESCSIQYLTATGDSVVLETAFVAGKITPESDRHDIAAIRRLAGMHGLELKTTDGTDMLQHVLLIPKAQTKGVADVVEWYDDAAGGTFYGQAVPRQDYHQYAESCLRRSAEFDDMVQEIVAQLISEAHTFTQPMDAILRLDELSGQFSIKRAIHDVSIDEAVFGRQAAQHVRDARFFMEQGDIGRAEDSLAQAQATNESSSCPLFKGETGNGDPQGSGAQEEEPSEKKWGHCPYCRALVFVDPCAKRIACWDCTALVVNGKIISTGNGGTRKRQQEAVSRRETQEKKLGQRSLFALAS